MIRSTVLFSGELIRIFDTRCQSPASRGTAEEQATSHQAVFTRRGLYVKHHGARRSVAEPMHVIFFEKGESYRVSHPVEGGDECTVLEFSDSVARALTTCVNPRGTSHDRVSFGATGASLSARLILAQQRLRRDLQSGIFDPLQVEEDALSILHALTASGCTRQMLQARGSDGTARTRRRLADDTRAVLAAHASHSVSLSTIARKVSASPFHLARVFRMETGMPIHQYHLRLRLTVALDRLTERDTLLSPLALELGFSSHSHFATVFRRTFGVPPSAFRGRRARI